MRCSPIFRLCGHIPKPLDLAEGLDVPHVILHSQDLVHVLDLDQRHEILHEIVGRPVAAVEAAKSCAVDPLLPSTGDADHMFLVILAQGIHDCPVDLITQFNVDIVFVVPLHTRLHQKIVVNQIIETSLNYMGVPEVLSKGTKDTALEAVLGSIVPVLDIGHLHFLQTRFLLFGQKGEQLRITGLAVRFRIPVVLGVIEGTDILLEMCIHCSAFHADE